MSVVIIPRSSTATPCPVIPGMRAAARRGEGGRLSPAPTVSGVPPIHNEASYLPGALSALRAELDALGETYEVILAENGSTDGTDRAAAHPAAAASPPPPAPPAPPGAGRVQRAPPAPVPLPGQRPPRHEDGEPFGGGRDRAPRPLYARP